MKFQPPMPRFIKVVRRTAHRKRLDTKLHATVDLGDKMIPGRERRLILAEVELQKENQVFERPSWLGEEVTHDERYFNSNLCSYPYSKWPKGKK